MRRVPLPAGLRAVFQPLLPTLLPLLVVGAAMVALDGGLRDPRHAPLGVVSFELCGLRGGDCDALLAHWSARQGLIAAFGLGLDFLFIPLYVLCLRAALCLGHPPLPPFWGTLPLVAGLFDGIENLALLRLLLEGPARAPALLAAAAASLKFLLLVPLLFLGLARFSLAWRQAAPAPFLR